MNRLMKRIILILLAVVMYHGVSAQNVVTDSLGFDKAAALSPAELLKGKMSGVRVSSSDGKCLSPLSVSIRGVNTLRGDNSPLYVIDGTLVNASILQNRNAFWCFENSPATDAFNNLFNLSAYDIESIEVIKDMSAAAIYGSKGANGVVKINTVKGNGINWNSDFGVADVRGGGFMHNHNVRVGGKVGASTDYNVSASFRQMNNVIQADSDDMLTLRANLAARPGKVLEYGTNILLSMGGAKGGDRDAVDFEDNADRYAATVSAYLNLNFTPWLSWRNNGGFDFRSIRRNLWYGSSTDFGAQYNGVVSVLATMGMAYNFTSSLTFDKCFADIHRLTAEAGVEVSGDDNDYSTLAGNDFPSHSLKGGGLALMNGEKKLHKYDMSWFHFAAFGRMTYDLNGCAGVQAVLHADNTRRYTDGKFMLYPAGSAYVDMQRIFFPESSAVSALRIEGGWGIAGKETALPYGFASNYIHAGYLDTDVVSEPYFEMVPYLVSQEWNAGIRASFLNDRIGLSLKYYDKLTSDRLDIYQFGVKEKKYWSPAARRNALSRTSDLSNRGVELDVYADVLRSKLWDVRLYANATYNHNRVLDLDYYDGFGSLQSPDGSFVTANLLGATVSSIIGYDVTAEGDYVDRNADGKINAADQHIIGSMLPEYYGGAGVNVRCGNFTLDVLADYAVGFDILDTGLLVKEGLKKVTSRYISRGDFFRLARVSLRYDIPVKWKWIKGLAVNVSGYNLLNESVYDGGETDPMAKSLLAGFNVRF